MDRDMLRIRHVSAEEVYLHSEDVKSTENGA